MNKIISLFIFVLASCTVDVGDPKEITIDQEDSDNFDQDKENPIHCKQTVNKNFRWECNSTP